MAHAFVAPCNDSQLEFWLREPMIPAPIQTRPQASAEE